MCTVGLTRKFFKSDQHVGEKSLRLPKGNEIPTSGCEVGLGGSGGPGGPDVTDRGRRGVEWQ